MTRRRKSNTNRSRTSQPSKPRSNHAQGGNSSNGGQVNTQKNDSPKNTNTQRRWCKVDLHIHTPASHDYEQPGTTYLDILRKAAAEKLDVIALTDHNTVAGVAAIRKEVEWLTRLERDGRLTDEERARLAEWRKLTDQVLVLPGFEFTATFGFHILGIFPPETSVRHLEHVLLKLSVPPDKLDAGSTETGANTDVLTAYREIRAAGGMAIAAHANSSHGVAMRDFPFGGQTKIAYTQDPNLDALEVTDLEKPRRSTARFFSGYKAEYPRRMHCIQGSDAHRLSVDSNKPKRLGVGERATDMFLETVSFEAIRDLLRSDNFDWTRPARPKDEPFDAIATAREDGPTITQSFHESASQRGGRLAAILADVCAFANTVGGTVYVGANHRKSTPKGLDTPKETQQEILAALEERISPPLPVKCDISQSEGADILRIRVPKGSDRPYCLDDYKFYIRDEGDTSQAVRDEIIALVSEVLESKQSHRSGRNGKRSASDVPAENKQQKSSGPSQNGSAKEDASAKEQDDAFYLPQVGVEIIESFERNGNTVHSIRDMRNGRIIKNVTRKRARKLWNYAIQQHEDHPVNPKKVQWEGNVGLVSADKRAGKTRYDLALRESGNVRVFYGVTEDGMEGQWATFIKDEE